MTKDKTITLKEFDENARGDLEKKIADMISDKQIVNILSGGKRLRPLLAHLAFKACTKGNESSHEYQRALEGGVVIELAHTASLVHDDIIDDDAKRRGKTSFHVKKGIASAILTGHKMLSTGFNGLCIILWECPSDSARDLNWFQIVSAISSDAPMTASSFLIGSCQRSIPSTEARKALTLARNDSASARISEGCHPFSIAINRHVLEFRIG